MELHYPTDERIGIFIPAPYVRGTQTLVIRNYGPAPAFNVRVTFDPPVPDPPPERD